MRSEKDYTIAISRSIVIYNLIIIGGIEVYTIRIARDTIIGNIITIWRKEKDSPIMAWGIIIRYQAILNAI